ncbi:SRPBCC family protein [uncultured Ruegeria sp.]|uniref:SRPBCC family protein n=1 Tax=uncultured Ruegeria sp. TaxID=259304 RepID=UPI0026227FE1|nr:SRPBCC family protein [uncultured Ruegeria sp.]
MIHHEKYLDINARPEDIWAVLGRFMHIDEFAPQVTSVDALTSGADGVGSKRRCHFENRTSLVEEVTSWDANQGYSVRLSDMAAMPMHEANATVAISPLADNRSHVTWSMDYRMKYGPFGWLMGQTLLKMMMGRVLAENLSALAAKVQSNPDAQPRTA